MTTSEEQKAQLVAGFESYATPAERKAYLDGFNLAKAFWAESLADIMRAIPTPAPRGRSEP